MQPPTIANKTQIWANLLEDLAHAKVGSKEGRKYLFVDSRGNFALFTNEKEAKKAGFTAKVSFAKIVKLTEEFLKDSKSIDLNFKAASALKVLTLHKFNKASKSKAILKTEGAFALALKLNPLPLCIASPTQLSNLDRCLSSTREVVRSEAGQTGIYYLVSDDINKPLALKLPFNPLSHILADRFYQLLSFTTPCYAAIPKMDPSSSDPVAPLSHRAYNILNLALASLKKKKETESGGDIEAHIGMLTTHMNRPYLTFMEVMEDARTVGNLTRDELAKILNHPVFLHQLGEMLLLDRFINNTDRLTELSVNVGNFMILETDTKNFTLNKKIIALLDHDFNIKKEDLPGIIKELRKIKDESYIRKLLTNTLVSKLNVSGHPIKIDNIDQAVKEVKKGVDAAIKQLRAVLNDDKISILLDVPSVPGCSPPDPQAVKDLLKKL